MVNVLDGISLHICRYVTIFHGKLHVVFFLWYVPIDMFSLQSQILGKKPPYIKAIARNYFGHRRFTSELSTVERVNLNLSYTTQISCIIF